MAYTTQTKIEDYKKRALNAYEVNMLDDVLPAVDAMINEILGVAYSSGDQTMYFDGGCTLVDLPGLTSITSVEYVDTAGGTTAIDSESYIAYPLNSARKTYLKHRSGQFNDGDGNIKIVGDTGAAPSEVVLAATMLASDLVDENNGKEKREKIGDWEVEYSDVSGTVRNDVMNLLAPYRDIMI